MASPSPLQKKGFQKELKIQVNPNLKASNNFQNNLTDSNFNKNS